MPQQQETTKTAQAAQILEAIGKMLDSVGTATGVTGGGGTSPLPSGSGPVSPTPTITFSPQAGTSLGHAPAPQRPSVPPTGGESIGSFPTRASATNAGLVSLGNSLSGLFSTIEQKEHAKKATLAENYLLQINGLLASGDPNDRKKAEMILEDPKIRKILKTGLEYVPLEEEVPPEAHGVQSAVQKISGQNQQKEGQPQPQKRPIIPQPSQEEQLKAAMTSALLQKIKQDPASAITMMGGSQLSSAEQHADEFYKAGLGLSPADLQTMTAQEKLSGLKIYEQAVGAAIRAEVDMYKTQTGYQGKVDAAKIFANARKYASDAMKEAWANRDKKKAGGANFVAGAKVYSGLAQKYLDIIKSGKGPDGIKPLTDEQKKFYQQKADALQRQADEYLNQAGDQELMEMFMKSLEEPDASSDDDEKPN